MKKNQLTRRQRWRIDKVHAERADRAAQRDLKIDAEGPLGGEQLGLVVAHFGMQVGVVAVNAQHAGGPLMRCSLRANLPALVTGDQVVWCAQGTDSGVVVAQLSRRSILSRPDARQVLKPVAANVDRIVVVIAPVPQAQSYLIDRYLVAAAHAGIEPLLLLNKADLLAAAPQAMQEILSLYRQLGYPVLEVSARQAIGMQELSQQLQGCVSVFVGQSGVGKSSLMNALLPGLQARVGALSEGSHLGMHTTTRTELFHLPAGGAVIDSPGIREFGLSHVSRSVIEAGFIEFAELLGRCRFRDCAHAQEPGCALLHALDIGTIHPQRMASYRQMLGDSCLSLL